MSQLAAIYRHLHSRPSGALPLVSRRLSTRKQLFPKKLAVIGSGSFGSAMTKILSKAAAEQSPETTLSWYARRQIVVDEINNMRTNKQYFPTVTTFAESIKATNDIHECTRGAEVVVLAVPSAFVSPMLKELRERKSIAEGAVLVSVLKSLKYDSNLRKMVTAVDQIRDTIPGYSVTALSGPNLYSEMASDSEFAEATIGYEKGDEEAARLVQMVTSSTCFQTSLTNDRIGLELCGGLKNVFSLATGFCEGLGLGWNARSALIRAGMHEITRFMTCMDIGHRSTVFETSGGVGDLVLTCTAGRGRTLAAAFVQYSLENGLVPCKESNVKRWETLEKEFLNGMKLPDWHNAQQIHKALTDMDIAHNFPILEAVHKIGFEGHHPQLIVEALSKSIVKAEQV